MHRLVQYTAIAAVAALVISAPYLLSLFSPEAGSFLASAWTLVTLNLIVPFFVALAAYAFGDRRQRELDRERIVEIQAEVRKHPDQPQLAWDLASAKLESYLDRNLSQLRWIFILTVFVMAIGFALVLIGLYKSFDETQNLPVTIVGAVSGVVISFIGGSFLLVYRSILAQSQEYVTVLERINAVGMAVQVINSISDDARDLRNNSVAGLAKQLIDLYSKPSTRVGRTVNARQRLKDRTTKQRE